MRAVDTNVVVRLVARDNPKQVAAAEAFVAKGAWASHLVLVETLWVLESVYKLGPREIARSVEMLLQHENLSLQEPDVVATALAQFRLNPSLGFSDCLILELARKFGHLPLGTFDRKLSNVEGAERVAS